MQHQSPSSPESKQNCPINLITLRDVLGDIDLGPLLTIFCEDAAAEIAKMKELYQAGDKESLLSYTHGLKGACATMYATAMRATCVQIENLCRNDDWENVAALLVELEQEYKQVEEYTSTLST